MIIQPTSLAALTWAGAAAGTSAPSWRMGVVYAARPLGLTELGAMVLQIGALTVETEPLSTPLPPQFQVRVLSLGSEPVLEVLGGPAAEPMVQRALLERLPQQNGFAPLLATLAALGQRAVVRQLPAALRPALAQLEQAMSTPAELASGEGLRQAIARSGLFLESQLLQATAGNPARVEQDWKAALLKLLDVLDQHGPEQHAATASDRAPTIAAETAYRQRSAPPLLQRGLQPQARSLPLALAALQDDAGHADINALLSRLQGDAHAALARVEVAQLEASTQPAWMIEIPLRGADGDSGSDVLQLQLEYAQAADGEAREWTLGFTLDLPGLGPVQGELQLRGLRVAVRLWAEHGASAGRLEAQFAGLRHRLAACGLLLDQLSCQVGMPCPLGPRRAQLLKATA